MFTTIYPTKKPDLFTDPAFKNYNFLFLFLQAEPVDFASVVAAVFAFAVSAASFDVVVPFVFAVCQVLPGIAHG